MSSFNDRFTAAKAKLQADRKAGIKTGPSAIELVADKGIRALSNQMDTQATLAQMREEDGVRLFGIFAR